MRIKTRYDTTGAESHRIFCNDKGEYLFEVAWDNVPFDRNSEVEATLEFIAQAMKGGE